MFDAKSIDNESTCISFKTFLAELLSFNDSRNSNDVPLCKLSNLQASIILK